MFAFNGAMIVFVLMRLMSFALAIMAAWGLVEPQRFFGTRVFAAIGLFMAAEIYVFSMFLQIR